MRCLCSPITPPHVLPRFLEEWAPDTGRAWNTSSAIPFGVSTGFPDLLRCSMTPARGKSGLKKDYLPQWRQEAVLLWTSCMAAMAHKNGWGNSEVLLPISLGNIGSQILNLGWGAKSFSQKSAVLGPQFLKTQVSVWTGLQDVSTEVTGISKM